LIVPTVLSVTMVGVAALAVSVSACHHSHKPIADARSDGGPSDGAPVDTPLV
jgi:hypothetical protein